MSDLVLEIDGEKFEVSKKVFDLVRFISEERDEYYELLEYTHKLLGKYERFQEIEDILQMQRKYRSDKASKN